MESSECCDEFLANTWKKDLCINCQRHVSEHKSVKSDTLPQQKTGMSSPGKSKLPTRTASSLTDSKFSAANSPPKPRRVASFNNHAVSQTKPLAAVRYAGSRPSAAPKSSPPTAVKPQSANKPVSTHKPGSANKPVTVNKPGSANKPVTATKPKTTSRAAADGGEIVNGLRTPKMSIGALAERKQKVTEPNSRTLNTTVVHYQHPKPTSVDGPDINTDEMALQKPGQQNKQRNILQPTVYSQPSSSIYDNASMGNVHVDTLIKCYDRVSSAAITSPKYDEVAREGAPGSQLDVTSPAHTARKQMTTSHESNKSERIYAEVTEDYLRPTEPSKYMNSMFNPPSAEYEELNLCRIENPVNSKSQTMPNSRVGEGEGITAASHPVQGKKMSFFKTLLKKGKKGESSPPSTGQKLEGLDSMPAPSKGRQMAAVDSWVAEQNSTNKMEVLCSGGASAKGPGGSATPSNAIRASLTVSTDRMDTKSLNIKSSISPTLSLQRPDEKPPPPPSAQTKSVILSSSSVPDHEKRPSTLFNNNNLPSSTKIKATGSVSSQAVDIHKVRTKTDSQPEGFYDTPWEDVDTVISAILTNKMEKSLTMAPEKEILKSPLAEGPGKSNIKAKIQAQHCRQTSMPECRSNESSRPHRSGKISPTSVTDSGYESTSTTRTVSRGQSNASDQSHSRSARNLSKPTPIDSIPLCLEQIGAMNNQTLQKLAKAYLQRNNQLSTDIKDVSWSDLCLTESTTPTHHNNKCVFYKTEFKEQPDQPITVMLSIKEPVACRTYSPNQLPVSLRFCANVDESLLPSQMLKATAANTSQSNSDSSSPDRNCDEAAGEASEKVRSYVTLLPYHEKLLSVTSYIKQQDRNCNSDYHLLMDSLFIVLQVISLIFSLAERQKELESLSAGDLVVSLDADAVSTVYCHMISVREATVDFNLACEKLKLFMIQLSHTSERLAKLKQFKTVDDLIQNSTDAGDLKTIGLIIHYMLWGPKDDEIRVMSTAENRKQSYELWLHLSRATLLNKLVFHPISSLKVYMMVNFLTNTSGNEILKITKLLSTY